MVAKATSKKLTVTGIKATTIGALQGTLFALIGLVTAITFALSSFVDFVDSTDSLLRGLTFGLANGILAIFVVPLVYFAIGWVIGALQGVVLNALVNLSGGVTVMVRSSEEEK